MSEKVKGRLVGKKKLLAWCDSPTKATGFGNVARHVLGALSSEYDISVLAINYYGDYHPLQEKYRLYNPAAGGDVYGFARIQELVTGIDPDVIWILNDPWMVAQFVTKIRQLKYTKSIVVYTPIDSDNIKPDFVLPLNQANVVVSYTQYGADEMRKAGLTVKTAIIPHGVDTTSFQPVDKSLAREKLFRGTPLDYKKAFIVGYVCRNQPRKRVDLFPYIFRKWLDKYPHDNVYMMYHGMPTGDLGWDIPQLAKRFNVDDRLIFSAPPHDVAVLPEEMMKYVYAGMDVYLQICAVEGWGMPLHEAMACGVPAIVPEYSALKEWPRSKGRSVQHVSVDPTPWFNPNNINTEHYFIDVNAAVEALEYLYQNPTIRDIISKEALAHATSDRFLWPNIGKQWTDVFQNIMSTSQYKGDAWKELARQIKTRNDK